MHRIRNDFQIKGLQVAALSFCVAAMAAASADEVLKLARKRAEWRLGVLQKVLETQGCLGVCRGDEAHIA